MSKTYVILHNGVLFPDRHKKDKYPYNETVVPVKPNFDHLSGSATTRREVARPFHLLLRNAFCRQQ
jgi:hypothetical protein